MAAMPFELKGKTVFVAGHNGMVGAALARRLAQEDVELLTIGRAQVDLRDQAAVNKWFAARRPQAVFLAAATVGGIVANNTLRAEFIYDNLAIAANVIHAAHINATEKLMFFGSSCIYPRLAPQPMREDSMLTGVLEPTNEPYAIAKIAGIKMVEAYRSQYGANFISVMPTNLYGRGDNYHPEYSHVVAALIRRFHEAKMSGAKEVVVWGTGTPRREFLYVDDLADACIHLMKTYPAMNWSISGPARTSRSPNSPAWSRRPSAMPARSVLTPRARTAPRENCSMSAGWLNSAGEPRPRWRTASGSPMRPISARQLTADLNACQRRCVHLRIRN